MAAPPWRLTVQLLKRLALPEGRRATRLFSLEGFRSMERALRSGFPIETVLVSESFARQSRSRNRHLIDAVTQAGLPLQVAPDPEVAELTGARGLGDVLAVLRQPPPPVLHELLQPGAILLAGADVSDPGNTGAMIRSALAAGADGFLACGITDPWHPKSVRTSMGSLFKLPILEHPRPDLLLEELKQRGACCIGTPCQGGMALPDFAAQQDPKRPLVIFMGSEAFGLTDSLLNGMETAVSIPMPEGVDSFSVNAAAAILLYTLGQHRKFRR